MASSGNPESLQRSPTLSHRANMAPGAIARLFETCNTSSFNSPLVTQPFFVGNVAHDSLQQSKGSNLAIKRVVAGIYDSLQLVDVPAGLRESTEPLLPVGLQCL